MSLIPKRGTVYVVDDDEAFGLVTRLVAKSFAGHAYPGMCRDGMLPHSRKLGEGRSGSALVAPTVFSAGG